MTPTLRLWAYLLGLSALWGSAFPLVRFAVQSMPPFALASARAAAAAAAIGVFLLISRSAFRPDRRMLRDMLVLGTINGWLPNVLTAASLGRITSAQGALIQACGPLMVAVLAALLLKEGRLTPRKLAGLALGLAGVAIIFAPLATEGAASLAGGALMLATALCYACGTVYARAVQPGASAPLILGQQVFSCLPALALSLTLDPAGAYQQPVSIWFTAALLGVFASAVPLTLYLHLLRTTQAADAALIGYLQPVWASALAAVLLQEWPAPRVLLGGAVVLAGVWLTTRAAPRA